MATIEGDEVVGEAAVMVCYWTGIVICIGCSIWLLNYSIIGWRTAVSAFATDYSTIVPVSVWSNSKDPELHD